MKPKYSRRHFVRTSGLNALGLGIAGNITFFEQNLLSHEPSEKISDDVKSKLEFVPLRAASWWCTLEDILWPQKKIVDKIKQRAESFAKAKIDTAINFGFHIRFDFSNYFGQLHGYYANVFEELHKYDIKFMDHYSCNHVERPRGEDEFRKLHKGQRHHILLFHDSVAAEHAQYEGHYFRDLSEIDLRDGSRGYARQYQMEIFCHNNPGFLDMHKKYLLRLMREVPFDGIEVDDMCDYGGLTTCGCNFCRERFRRDYGHEIPPFGNTGFWGDTTKNMLLWGNYDNPVFRDWIRMKIDSVADHIKIIKNTIGNKPLMTCCSSTGPVALNSIALNLERLAPHLDFFMLENVGTNINCVDWAGMDAEALQQKDIALKSGNSPALALSYTIYEKGGYLGWGLSRFWGVANWGSTLNQRLEDDPVDAMETEAIIGPLYNWELANSNLCYHGSKDLSEVRLASSSLCRDNGWHGTDGSEQWDRVKDWSVSLLRHNVNYRIIRAAELSDPVSLRNEDTPLILDGLGCVSDNQFKAIKAHLSGDGIAWLSLPFGTHDERGNKRTIPLSVELLKSGFKNLILKHAESSSDFLEKLIGQNIFHPVLKQLTGDTRWVARIRIYNDEPAIHFMNTALIAVPHPSLKDIPGVPVLKDIESDIENNNLSYSINCKKVPLSRLSVLSPELGQEKRNVEISRIKNGYSTIKLSLDRIKIYAVAQLTEM